MTDNTGVSLTRDEAIDRMKAGLPCETKSWPDLWGPTRWADFDFSHVEFRIPPESRRVAREWRISPAPKGKTNYDYAFSAQHSTGIHVREVLPDEVTLQMLGRDDARLALYKAIHAIEFGNKTDDKLIIAQLADQGVYLAKEVKS